MPTVHYIPYEYYILECYITYKQLAVNERMLDVIEKYNIVHVILSTVSVIVLLIYEFFLHLPI